MINVKKNSVSSPLGVFFLYIAASALVIIIFRLIFPGSTIPLAHFSKSWRLIRGLLDYLRLFPALVLSSLVIPFGLKIRAHEKINPFSPQFLQYLKMPVFTTIVAAAIYGLLFFLVLPLAQNYEANLLFESRLFRLSKEKAQDHAALEEWADAAQFVAVCERIWPKSPEMERLKIEVEIRSEGERLISEHPLNTKPETISWMGLEPVNATEALEMAETALTEERFFDAHWLATLGGQLAPEGSPEKAIARRLAGRAWQAVNSLAPTNRESRAYTLFRLKRDGHEALLGSEWIRAYYIFLELNDLTPNDPDVAKYLAMSQSGIKQIAFFIDEMEMSLGKILTGAIFSLPLDSGRLVMRIASLSTLPDSAYGIGAELMAFNREGRPLWSMEAPYVKIMPLALGSGDKVAVLLRALDRHDKTKYWEPVITGLGQSVIGNAEITFNLNWDNFLLLSNVRRGLNGLSPVDLKKAADNLGDCGYLPQVFEAEILRRFTEPLLLLPMGIFALVIGWRYRALKRPRYMNVLMLGILPLVFSGAVHFVQDWVNNLGILAVASLGFAAATVFFGIGMVVLLILSLIILAAQHG